jgi:hypothetical protein
VEGALRHDEKLAQPPNGLSQPTLTLIVDLDKLVLTAASIRHFARAQNQGWTR